MSAEKFISNNGAEVHDRVRIETDSITYEGLILPKHNFSKENIIILKFDNGYNIGVSTKGAKLSILSKAKPKETLVEAKKKNKANYPWIFARLLENESNFSHTNQFIDKYPFNDVCQYP